MSDDTGPRLEKKEERKEERREGSQERKEHATENRPASAGSASYSPSVGGSERNWDVFYRYSCRKSDLDGCRNEAR